MTTGKVVLIGGGIAAVGGLAYWLFVIRKNNANANAAASNIAQAVDIANSNILFSGVTIESLKNQVWVNSSKQEVTSLLRGYDPSTGVVTHANSGITGFLLGKNKISWTSTGGGTDIWSGFPKSSSFPTKAQMLAAIDSMDFGGGRTPIFKHFADVPTGYSQSTGRWITTFKNGFRIQQVVCDVVSIEPIAVRYTTPGAVLIIGSTFFVSQHPELKGLGSLKMKSIY